MYIHVKIAVEFYLRYPTYPTLIFVGTRMWYDQVGGFWWNVRAFMFRLLIFTLTYIHTHLHKKFIFLLFTIVALVGGGGGVYALFLHFSVCPWSGTGPGSWHKWVWQFDSSCRRSTYESFVCVALLPCPALICSAVWNVKCDGCCRHACLLACLQWVREVERPVWHAMTWHDSDNGRHEVTWIERITLSYLALWRKCWVGLVTIHIHIARTRTHAPMCVVRRYPRRAVRPLRLNRLIHHIISYHTMPFPGTATLYDMHSRYQDS